MDKIAIIVALVIVFAFTLAGLINVSKGLTNEINENCQRLNWSGGDWKRKNGKMVFYCFDSLEEVLFQLDNPISKEIEKEEEKLVEQQCSNLTEEDVKNILYRNFTDTFQMLLAVDNAFGKPKLVPILQYYCK